MTDQSIAENIVGKEKNKIKLIEVKEVAEKAQISQFIEKKIINIIV